MKSAILFSDFIKSACLSLFHFRFILLCFRRVCSVQIFEKVVKINIQKSFSIRKYIRWGFITVILLFGTASLAYSGFTSYHSAKSSLREFSISMQIYMDNLSSALQSESDFNQVIVASDSNFALLSTNGVSGASSLPPLYNLRQIINYHDNACCVNMISDYKLDGLYYSSKLFPVKNTQAYRAAYRRIGESCFANNAVLGQWFHEKVADDDYLIFQNRKGSLGLCTMFSLQKYTSQYPIPSFTDNSVVSIFSSDKVIKSRDILENRGIGLVNLQNALNTSHLALYNGNLVFSYYIEGCHIGIAVVTPFSEFFMSVLDRILMAIIFLILMVLIFVVFYTTTSWILLTPIVKISDFSKEITQTHSYSVSKPSRIKEMQNIQAALVSLAKTVSELEAIRRTEEEKKVHALLQYYQLQTRSHFFLNCLKSLYGMLESAQIDKMKLMIIAFSNHLRYLFHDNISTVPLSSELQEIEDYYQILSLDSGKIFLLNIEVEEELTEYLVPPLVIQSFLENSFKYNDGKKGVVLFSVKVNSTMENDSAYMCIHMQDNGEGYPGEVLDAINQRVRFSFEDNHVGINNLKHRLSILYGEKYSFAFYNLPGGGACSTISIPLIRN